MLYLGEMIHLTTNDLTKEHLKENKLVQIRKGQFWYQAKTIHFKIPHIKTNRQNIQITAMTS